MKFIVIVHTEVDLVLDLVHTEEVDLISVFDVAVTLIKSHNCHYRETVCHACGKKGHLAKVCHSSWTYKSTSTKGKPPADKLKNNWIDSPTEVDEAEPFPDDSILKVQGHSIRPITVTLELNGKSVVMEVDTGAAVSLMSEEAVS